MSEEFQKKLDMALAKIAALEAEKSKPKAAPRFDPVKMETDPVAHLAELGINIEHVTKHVVRNALGDQAPQHLKDYADQGKQLVATKSALETKIDALAGAVESIVGGAKRESFKTLATDKSKYPHLAAAYAVDPEQFGDVQGDPAEIAAQMDAKYAKYAEALGAKPQSASDTAATVAQGQQAKPAPTADAFAGAPPPTRPMPGLVTDDVYAQLKAETVAKHDPPQR